MTHCMSKGTASFVYCHKAFTATLEHTANLQALSAELEILVLRELRYFESLRHLHLWN